MRFIIVICTAFYSVLYIVIFKYIVSLYFEPSQPQRIISGLDTNFTRISKLVISPVILLQVLFLFSFF